MIFEEGERIGIIGSNGAGKTTLIKAVKHIMGTVLHTSIRKNQKLHELIEYFEFGPCLGKRYKALSGGQKQRFTIIMVMMQDACSLGLWPGSC